jgi:hypothetical protein
MKRNLICNVAAGVLVVSSILMAQEELEFPEPAEEHQWLKQFVGEWTSESDAKAGPDQPPIKCKGTMSSRMLGGFWVVSEVKSDMGEIKVNAVQTIGYDPEKKKYVGTWVDSMTNHMWHYEGTIDESGKKLTLEAEGPNFMSAGQTAKYRDAYEFKSEDHIVATSSMQGDDGKWVTFMTGDVRRVE